MVEDPVGQETDVDAVEHAGEPVHHAGQSLSLFAMEKSPLVAR